MKKGTKSIFSVVSLLFIATITIMYILSLENVEANPGNKVTVDAGKEGSPFSYWGFTKSGSYTTVRLQTDIKYPVATYTFEELPARIRIGGILYDIIEYDNTQITVEKIS